MPRRLRVGHCSDIHLDGDHHSIEFYKQRFDAVLASIEVHDPDVILLAGDLFDANSASDDTIRWAMQRLDVLERQVVMITGNHDCLEPGGIYERYDFDGIHNVEFLTHPAGELRKLARYELAVWGKGLVDHTPDHQPLDGCPGRPDDCAWLVGLGHGIYVPKGNSTDRSSPVSAHEIEASPCDYIALGHHHAALEVHESRTAAAYSGSPTDRIGGDYTYAMIDLEIGQPARVEVHAVDDGEVG